MYNTVRSQAPFSTSCNPPQALLSKAQEAGNQEEPCLRIYFDPLAQVRQEQTEYEHAGHVDEQGAAYGKQCPLVGRSVHTTNQGVWSQHGSDRDHMGFKTAPASPAYGRPVSGRKIDWAMMVGTTALPITTVTIIDLAIADRQVAVHLEVAVSDAMERGPDAKPSSSRCQCWLSRTRDIRDACARSGVHRTGAGRTTGVDSAGARRRRATVRPCCPWYVPYLKRQSTSRTSSKSMNAPKAAAAGHFRLFALATDEAERQVCSKQPGSFAPSAETVRS
jgi:hypothetical protein